MNKYFMSIVIISAFLCIVGCNSQQESISKSSTWEILSTDNIVNIELVEQWGKGYIRGVDITEDGNLIAVAASTGVYLYNGITMDETLIYPPNGIDKEHITAVAISANKKYLAMSDANIQILDIKNEEISQTIENRFPDDKIKSLAFSDNGKYLIVMGDGSYNAKCDATGGHFQLFNLKKGTMTYSQEYCPELLSYKYNSLTNGYIAFSGTNPNFSRWTNETTIVNPSNDKVVEEYINDEHNRIYDFSADGTMMAQKNFRDGISYTNIINTTTDTITHSLEGDIVFLPYTNNLILRNYAFRLDQWELWDLQDNQICSFTSENEQLYLSSNTIYSSENFSGKYIITASYSGEEVQIWNTTNCELIQRLPFINSFDDLVFEKNGKFLASASRDSFHVWDTNTGNTNFSIERRRRPGPYNIYDFLPAQDTFITSMEYESDMPMYFWNLQTNELIHQMDYRDGYGANDIAISPDGSTMLTQHVFKMRIWDTETYTILSEIDNNSYTLLIENVYSPDSSKIAIITVDNQFPYLEFVDVTSGNIIFTIPIPYTRELTLSPDWQSLAVPDSDNNILLWKIEDIKSPLNLKEPFLSIQQNEYLQKLTFSPDSKILAGLSYSQIQFWDAQSGEFLGRIESELHFTDLAFNPDQHSIAAIAMDGTIKIYAVPSEKNLQQ